MARHGLPASPEELDGHAGIAYSRAGALSPWQVRDIDGQVRQVRIQRQVSLDDVQAIAAAAIEGFGLAWLPSWLLSRYEKTGELVVVMNSWHAAAGYSRRVAPNALPALEDAPGN